MLEAQYEVALYVFKNYSREFRKNSHKEISGGLNYRESFKLTAIYENQKRDVPNVFAPGIAARFLKTKSCFTFLISDLAIT